MLLLLYLFDSTASQGDSIDSRVFYVFRLVFPRNFDTRHPRREIDFLLH